MKYVLDASVALKWVVPEPDSQRALQLRDEFNNGVHELLAPDIFLVEAAHVNSKLERRGLLKDGNKKLLHILQNQPALHPYIPLLADAYDLSAQFRIGVYDCLYLALAEQEQCDLVTADVRLLNATQLPYVKLLSSLP